DHTVGATEGAEAFRLAHPLTPAAWVMAAESPALREAVRFQHRQHGGDVSAGIGRQIVELRIINPTAGVFDVVRIVTEPAQADQEMKKLVSYPGEWIPGQNPEDDDFTAGGYAN